MILSFKDIDILLGEPIRADVAASTGIELAFHTLSAITQCKYTNQQPIFITKELHYESITQRQECASPYSHTPEIHWWFVT